MVTSVSPLVRRESPCEHLRTVYSSHHPHRTATHDHGHRFKDSPRLCPWRDSNSSVAGHACVDALTQAGSRYTSEKVNGMSAETVINFIVNEPGVAPGPSRGHKTTSGDNACMRQWAVGRSRMKANAARITPGLSRGARRCPRARAVLQLPVPATRKR